MQCGVLNVVWCVVLSWVGLGCVAWRVVVVVVASGGEWW